MHALNNGLQSALSDQRTMDVSLTNISAPMQPSSHEGLQHLPTVLQPLSCQGPAPPASTAKVLGDVFSPP
jgi:hypothetical protein